MSDLFGRAVEILRREGPVRLARKGWQYAYREAVARHLPRRPAEYNGVTVLAARALDGIVPFRPVDRPAYESGLVGAIEREVDPGDTVVVVGGGWGVTTVRAAEAVGPGGRVVVFEGAAEYVERLRETVALNGVADTVEVRHAVVGPGRNLRGESTAATRVAPTDLPECDVLELDCEGAELAILADLAVRPRTLLVESHGMYDAPTDAVADALEALSYAVVDETIATEEKPRTCEIYDIRVVVARDESA